MEANDQFIRAVEAEIVELEKAAARCESVRGFVSDATSYKAQAAVLRAFLEIAKLPK